MTQRQFMISLWLIASVFTLFFLIWVLPAVAETWNIPAAFAAGFVNPFAAGYSTDVIMCWVTLAAWVLYDRQQHQIKYGWLCLLLGLVPGVATGFACYLILRLRQNSAL